MSERANVRGGANARRQHARRAFGRAKQKKEKQKQKEKMKKSAVSIAALAALPLAAAVNVVPLPQKVVEKEGSCVLEGCRRNFAVDPAIPAEGYRLVIEKDAISIVSSDEAGRFYALQTLAQLSAGGKAPCVEIEDAPRFKWRGLHWDDCRHFMGKEALMKTLRTMAYFKLNVLHWHLTDDQGWRIEIKKYPELTRKGAVRPGSPKPAVLNTPGKGGWQNNHIPYGPYFYTQDDIREIVAFANALHIKIVPEIELPGHARAAVAAYPWLGCTGEAVEPWWRWGVSKEIFCAGNPDTLKFLEGVLDEVCELFPGDAVHIGGDEAPKDAWKKCPKCQFLIKEMKLDGEEALQGVLTKHFTDYLAKKGKRAIGWDEILDGNPGKDTIIMSWRGPGGGIKAAARGNDAVMTPVDPCYLDNPQGLSCDPYEYINYGFAATLERCYGFDPVAGIPENERHRILGGQGNNWTEYTWDSSAYEWKLWPRMCALAECLWTEPERKAWPCFKARISAMRPRLVNEFKLNAAPVE